MISFARGYVCFRTDISNKDSLVTSLQNFIVSPLASHHLALICDIISQASLFGMWDFDFWVT